MKNTKLNGFLTLFCLLGATVVTQTFAEETVGEKMEANGRETKTSIKKGARKVKKNVRDATGRSSIVEDTKDSLRNSRDETSDKLKEIKNKVD
jgi:hypothetical protein